MDSSPFSKVPREIRDHIYELALAHEETILAYLREDDLLRLHHSALKQSEASADFNKPRKAAATTLAGLPTTCRQLRTEAAPLFFSGNTFRIIALSSFHNDEYAVKGESLQAKTISEQLGQKYMAHIKDMTIEQGRFYIEDLDGETMVKLGHTLGGLKRCLHHNAILRLEATFDYLDFSTVPEFDGAMTATVCIPVGDLKGAGEELSVVINGKVTEYLASHAVTLDPTERTMAIQSFHQFGEAVWEIFKDVASG